MRRKLWPYAGKTEMFIFGKVRARMLVLSLKAMQLDCLLVCTTDRSEWSVGFYDPHGDGVGDIAPLCHLYKTQIRELARVVGVADEILKQPSSGDLAAGLPNETAIGLRYEQLDRVLVGLSLGIGDEEIAAVAGVQRSMVNAIRSTCKLADERRGMPVGVEQAIEVV
jgi:NAD+ synthase